MKQYRPLVIAAYVAACATAAAAQSERGRLIGSVRDASNAFVGGATVTIRNERTSDARTTETDPQVKILRGIAEAVDLHGQGGHAGLRSNRVHVDAGRRAELFRHRR